jgi:hypothetical protein
MVAYAKALAEKEFSGNGVRDIPADAEAIAA